MEVGMAGWMFEAPGGLKDFSNPDDWHAAMAREASDIITILVATSLNKDPEDVTEEDIAKERDKLAYVDPTKSPPPADANTVPIQAWNGFPRAVVRAGPWKEFPPVEGDIDGNHRAVEHLGDEDHRPGKFVDRHGNVLDLPARDRQDEYLEWVAKRNNDGKIVKLTFVAEGYDYFSELFEHDEKTAVQLYRDLTGVSSITADDLRAKDGIDRMRLDGRKETVARPGGFNPRNKYNIDPGIVHLSHRANSLGAEVNLAGVSGIARKKASGTLLDGKNEEELLCCNQGGNPNRHSDPLISKEAYAQVLQGSRYTLANPVGLYIAAVEESGLLMPDNKTQVPREWWREVRGGGGLWDIKKSRVLRLEFEVPAKEKITISDLLVGGTPVNFAGQIAELLSVHLFVTVWKRNDASIGPTVKCDATCCRKKGSERLELSGGKCGVGYELAFPDLLPVPVPGPGHLSVTMAAKPLVDAPSLRSQARR
jgi:hypothetical protein